jgi:hypothetical protein
MSESFKKFQLILTRVPQSRPFLHDWLIDYLGFYVPLKYFSLIWRRHHCRWRAAKFWPLLGALGLWGGRDLYRATPAVTRDLGFFGLIQRNAPFSCILRHTKGCEGSILTRIVMWVILTWENKLRRNDTPNFYSTVRWSMVWLSKEWYKLIFTL